MIDRTVTNDWLKASAAEIESQVRAGDRQVFQAARLLVEAKARLDGGEWAPLTWKEWSKSLDLGERRVRELLRIGRAEDGSAELNNQRAANSLRQKRHRVAQAARTVAPAKVSSATPPSVEHASSAPQAASSDVDKLIVWVSKARPHQIRAVLTFIANLDGHEDSN